MLQRSCESKLFIAVTVVCFMAGNYGKTAGERSGATVGRLGPYALNVSAERTIEGPNHRKWLRQRFERFDWCNASAQAIPLQLPWKHPSTMPPEVKSKLHEELRSHYVCGNSNLACSGSLSALLAATQPQYSYTVLFRESKGTIPTDSLFNSTIGIATHLSPDRITHLHEIVKYWEGEVVAVVWVPNAYQVSVA